MESYDIVVVGAGVSGLCAAHTFLHIDPSLSLLILESQSDLGGVWSSERLYPGLVANNHEGYYEFSDFPLLDAGLGIKPRGIFSGKNVNAYLRKYAQKFDLERRIRLNTNVIRATEKSSSSSSHAHSESGWELEITTSPSSSTTSTLLSCKKLLIATGTSNLPSPLSFPGLSTFTPQTLHSISLGKLAPTLLSSPSIQHVVVIGGSKSAHDSVHLFASANKRVTWILHRPDKGAGAMPMAKSTTPIGPFKVWSEGLLMLRPLTWFCAAPWADGDGFGWIRGFLHGTKLGNWVVRGFFAKFTGDLVKNSGITRDERTEVLRPDGGLMWYGSQSSSLNYEGDFYEAIRDGRVRVVREEVERLEGRTVWLEDGTGVECDALVCGTGWDFRPTVRLEPEGKMVGWGCPVRPEEDGLHGELVGRADRELFSRFPLLRRSPRRPERKPEGLTPWRLWRFVAPPSQVPGAERNLVFLNTIKAYQFTIKAELTSLWAYAYLYDKLTVPTPTEEDARYEACLWSRFGKWQTPYGMQGKTADFLLNSMPYFDLLMRDLGLRSWRRGWGILGEIFGHWYMIKDYKGVVDEWIASQSKTLQDVSSKTKTS